MFRIVRLCCLTYAASMFLVITPLAILRHTTPQQLWVIFSLSHQHDSGYDIYRMLSDGSHAMKLAMTGNQGVNVSRWERPGWVTLEHRVHGLEQLALVHMSGRQEILLEGNFGWLSTQYYDKHDQQVYITAYDPSDPYRRELWLTDLRTGHRSQITTPLDMSDQRSEVVNGRFVFWSDATSKGDLYQYRLGDPPDVQQLTTRGDILQVTPAIAHAGWVYFYAGEADLPGPWALYRMRLDGTDEQLVAEQVLVLPEGAVFWTYSQKTIYYWAGEANQPYLVRADPDGGHATPLPITPFTGRLLAWSPQQEWAYFRQQIQGNPDYLGPAHLVRVNMQTGESTKIIQNEVIYQVTWTPDYQWLLVVTEGENGYRCLYRMRPDGSEATLITDKMRDYITVLEQARLVMYEEWGRVDLGLQVLDLDTFETHELQDGLPRYRVRSLLTTLPMPDYDWQPLGLGAIGLVVGGLGLGHGRWRRHVLKSSENQL